MIPLNWAQSQNHRTFVSVELSAFLKINAELFQTYIYRWTSALLGFNSQDLPKASLQIKRAMIFNWKSFSIHLDLESWDIISKKHGTNIAVEKMGSCTFL